nr:YolD-like family protein [Virgibacillus sp. AGTR]
MKLQMAVKNDLTVELKYFSNHDYYNAKGKIASIDRQNKYIKVAGQYLPIESIIDVWID